MAEPLRDREPHETHLIGWNGPIAQLDITWASDPERSGCTVTVGADWGQRIAEAAKRIVTGAGVSPGELLCFYAVPVEFVTGEDGAPVPQWPNPS